MIQFIKWLIKNIKNNQKEMNSYRISDDPTGEFLRRYGGLRPKDPRILQNNYSNVHRKKRFY